jgi:hypothetical protein
MTYIFPGAGTGEVDAAGADGYCNNEQPADVLYPVAYRLLCPDVSEKRPFLFSTFDAK